MLVELSKIRRDGGTQLRAATNSETVSNYTAVMAEGEKMPPLATVFDGQDHWLYDGFHRLDAAIRAGLREYECEVVYGDRDLAIWLAIAANAKNALPRTTLDKQRAVEAALLHPRSKGFSDRSIAKHVGGGVDHKTVAAARRRLVAAGEVPQSDTRTTSDGRTMNVAGINANRQPEPVLELIKINWTERMLAAENAEEGRALFGELENYINGLQTSKGLTPTCGRIDDGFSVGFSCVTKRQWQEAINAAKRVGPSFGASFEALIADGQEMNGEPWLRLYRVEIATGHGTETRRGKDTSAPKTDDADDKIPEPEGGWPEANEDGTYDTELAEPIFCNKGHAQAVIHVLRIEPHAWKGGERWIANAAITGVPGCELATDLCVSEICCDSRGGVIRAAAQEITKHILRCIRDESLLASRHATLLRFLDWAIGEQGADRVEAELAIQAEDRRRDERFVTMAEQMINALAALVPEGWGLRDREEFGNWGRIVLEMMKFADEEVEGQDEMRALVDQVDEVEARFAAVITAIREHKQRAIAA